MIVSSPVIADSNLSRLVNFTTAAELDLERLHDWLFDKNPDVAMRLIKVLQDYSTSLADFADRGRSIGDGVRELVVPFGGSSYVVRYEVTQDDVLVARIWHGLEDR